MNRWKELTKTRKMMMTVVEACLVLMFITLLLVVVIGNKGLDTGSRVRDAFTTLRMASDQLDLIRLDVNKNQTFLQAQNLQSMTTLPNTLVWANAKRSLNKAQVDIGGILQSRLNWQALATKNQEAYVQLEKIAKDMIDQNKGAATAQDVFLAAQTIHDWLKKPPQDMAAYKLEADFATEKLTLADSLLEEQAEVPAIAPLRNAWTAWMDNTQELLLEEAGFLAQKKSAEIDMASYAVNLDKAYQDWMLKNRFNSFVFAGLFGVLILIVVITLQSLKRNPHLNTMFAPKTMDVLQAELESVNEQVDNILSNVSKAWLDSRNELKVVHHAITDSEMIEDQVVQIKTDLGVVLNQISKGLREIEQMLRNNNSTSADQVAAFLGEVQTQNARIQQSLEVLAESGISINEELTQVRQTIRRLMTEALSLKKEGEELEDSSDTLRSSVE